MNNYWKIRLKNMDPLRIADDKSSQHGQTDTLRYIPGSALRGYVMSELAKQAEFETWKPAFFNGQIRFMNAYLTVNGKELIPSLKGFFEDKTPCIDKKRFRTLLKRMWSQDISGHLSEAIAMLRKTASAIQVLN